MNLLIDNPALTQSQFFGVGVLLIVVGTIAGAIQRKVPVPQAIALVTLVLASAAVGGRLWAKFVGGSDVELFEIVSPGYASAGAIIGGIVVMLPLLKAQKFWSYADVIAPALVLGLAATRLGCLFNGCDYGILATRGMTYGPSMMAYEAHLAAGIIKHGAAHSANVFPLPVMMAGSALFASGVGFFSNDAPPGAAAARVLVVYLFGRGFLELFRSVDATHEMSLANPNIWLALCGAFVGIAILRDRQSPRIEDLELE